MRCNCTKCRENENGYCGAPSYVEIDEDGTCGLMLIPMEREEKNDEV